MPKLARLSTDEPAYAGDVMKQFVGFVVGILIPVLIMMAGGISNSALAQAWPSKPMRIVIAQAPGSATDVISRVVGNQLSVSLGQPIVIDARPGAGGVLGTEVAARSAHNGSTHHFCGELLKSMTGIDILHIPYKGSGPGIAGLLGGEVSMMFSNVADIG